MQKEDASFVSYGVSNAESCCQVIIALTALGIDPETDARFVKNGKTVLDALQAFRLPDGSFAHVTGGKRNNFACQQALLAYVALERFAEGKGGLYAFDPKPTAPPENDDTQTSEPMESTVSSLAERQESIDTPAKDGMPPIRTTVLILALIIGLASLVYLLIGKK